MKTTIIYHSNGAKTYYENGVFKFYKGAQTIEFVFTGHPVVLDASVAPSQPLSMRDWFEKASEYLSGYMGFPICIEAKKPITQASINKAFGTDLDDEKSLAAILKKAQRHL